MVWVACVCPDITAAARLRTHNAHKRLLNLEHFARSPMRTLGASDPSLDKDER
jgi:hypothetical protein